MTDSRSTSSEDRRVWWRDLYEELKRRRVVRVATLYLVVFWPIIQVVDILSPALGLPNTAMRALIIAFVGGFPVVLILAWIFDLNRGGVIRDQGQGETGQALIGSRLEVGIIGFMLFVVAGLYYVQTTQQTNESVVVQQPATTASATTPFDSIAVLPFDTFSQEKRDRFFADGLTEELLNVLSRINGLQVAARTSSFAYRGVNKTVQEIGKELNVDVILEGSVRRNDVDDTIRVTAQLVNTKSGTHFWSRTFDRKFTDVFKIQDEIAAAVVDQLKVTLLGGEADEIRSHASASPEAMITYSMGQTELAKRTQISLEDAIRFFKRAIEDDPNYVEAWVGLADANSLIASYRFGDLDSHVKAAQEAVDTALTMDPQSGMAWASQGLIYQLQNKKQDAKLALEKAIELNPSYAMAHMWYASVLDDPDEQFQHFERAYKLDPRSPVAAYNVASMLVQRGREAEAMEVFSKIIEADPYYPKAYELVATISARRGRMGDAIRQYEKAYELQPDPNTAFQIARLEVSIGNFASANEWTAIARPKEPPERYVLYDWLKAQQFAMEEKPDKTREVLQRIAKPAGEYEAAYLVAAYASYLLEDAKGAVQDWETSKKFSDDDMDHVNFGPVVYDLARIAAAWGYQRTGRTRQANELLAAISKSLDEAVKKGGDSDPDLWYRYALVKALTGQPQMALIDLQRAVDEGWRDYWQPPLEPSLKGLIQDTEFQAMMAGVETRMNLIREQMGFDKSFASAPTPGASGS